MSGGDYRDLTIAELADREAELLERLVDLTIDRDSYRELARQAIRDLHDLICRHDRLLESHYRLRDARRATRMAPAPRQEAA